MASPRADERGFPHRDVSSASGGLQDAYTYIGRGKVFANAQTGNIAADESGRSNGDLSAGVLHYLDTAALLCTGVAAAEVIHTSATGKPNTCIGGSWCWWWRFCCSSALGSSPNTLDLAANALVCPLLPAPCRCRLSARYTATRSPAPCASATCAAAWNRWWSTFHLHDKKVLHKALHYFGVILLFAIGAGVGASLCCRIWQQDHLVQPRAAAGEPVLHVHPG
ncbi:MAG: YoaK family protein [Angelakisella sp.]